MPPGALEIRLRAWSKWSTTPRRTATFAEACEGETVIPTGVVAGPQYSYAWSIYGNATWDKGASTAAPEIDNVACGDSVSLVVTETFLVDGDIQECPSEEQTVVLDVVAFPQPELTTASPLCNGVDVVLDLTDLSEETGVHQPKHHLCLDFG